VAADSAVSGVALAGFIFCAASRTQTGSVAGLSMTTSHVLPFNESSLPFRSPSNCSTSFGSSPGWVRPRLNTVSLCPRLRAYRTWNGHKVTVFNRGRTHPGELPKEVEQLIGDRNGQLDALKGRKWDVVIDNPTTLPSWVRDAAAVAVTSPR